MNVRVIMKYIGSTEPFATLTTNQDYDIVAFVDRAGSFTGIVLDDNDVFHYVTKTQDPMEWQLVSVAVLGNVQLYP